MAGEVITPNMSLIVPATGVTAGPQYANDINNSLTIIDQHDHSSGNGVQITPSGLNINSDLTIGSNNLIALRSVRFTAQGAPLALAADLGCLYESGVDLYYNDGSGNQIRITQGGAVSGASGTITGLPSGTASAAYAAGTFTFQSATNTAANIDGGSFILRNSTASSNGLTLQPPNAMAANYSLTLPALPAQTNLLTLDTSGNMSSVTWNAAAQNVTRSNGTTVGLLGVAKSTPVTVTHTSTAVSPALTTATITTSGRPVFVGLVSTSSGYIGVGSTGDTQALAQFYIYSNGSLISTSQLNSNFTGFSQTTAITVPPGCVYYIDTPAAGTYAYDLRVSCGDATTTAYFASVSIVAYEL